MTLGNRRCKTLKIYRGRIESSCDIWCILYPKAIILSIRVEHEQCFFGKAKETPKRLPFCRTKALCAFMTNAVKHSDSQTCRDTPITPCKCTIDEKMKPMGIIAMQMSLALAIEVAQVAIPS